MGPAETSGHLYPTPASPKPSSSRTFAVDDDDTVVADAPMDDNFFSGQDGTPITVEIDDPVQDDDGDSMDVDETSVDIDKTLLDTDETLLDIDETLDVQSADEDLEDVFQDPEDGDNSGAYGGDAGSHLPRTEGQTEIAKAVWTEEMVQTEEMAGLGICVNSTARVIVCLACSSAIKPSEIRQHLRKHQLLSSTTDTFFQDLIKTYDLIEDPVRARPGRIITAIYGLELFTGFFSCDTCGHAYKLEKKAKQHVSRTPSCDSYSRRYTQILRPSAKQGYFGVDLSSTTEPIEDPLDPLIYLEKKFAPPLFQQIPITCPSPRDANHFLNLEHWNKHVEGRTGADLINVTREREPELRAEVRVAVERYARDAVKCLERVDNEFKKVIGDYLG